MSDELAELEAMLERLRAMRNRHSWTDGREVRQAYNAACDRLDVLCCRVYQAQPRQPTVRIRGFWSRVWNR